MSRLTMQESIDWLEFCAVYNKKENPKFAYEVLEIIKVIKDSNSELQHYKDLEEQGRLIEQKHGLWYPMHFGGVWQCSECGYLTNDNKATRYCPDCGAKMDEVEK